MGGWMRGGWMGDREVSGWWRGGRVVEGGGSVDGGVDG